ncbi:MAG TPA: hypothetical protein VEB22_15325 [Phycisphaerales bacterium]|nr:hypothetical protein [Phycisphaerales bacterium]
MTEQPCQRWRAGRASYRPAREVVDTRNLSADLLDERPAKSFVVEHHYSHTYPAARLRVGLYQGRALVGVAVFGEPAQQATLGRWAPGARDGVVLSRFVLLDEVGANAETWLLARAFRLLRRERPELEAIVSYSDPLPRRTLAGEVVVPGHVGTIYQAHNGRYLGRSKPETLHLAGDGRVISRRALGKIRLDHRGAAYAYRQLLEMGAPPRRPLEEGPAYVLRALREGPFRVVRHPGNHVYAWALGGEVEIGPERTRPKQRDQEQPGLWSAA